MENEPVQLIRKTTRDLLNYIRRNLREEICDNRRPSLVFRVTPPKVAEIANKLKTKSSITAEELHILKNGMNDVKNIELFLSVHGSLRGLVRELTGHDVSKQCEAAGCCGNIALSDFKASLAVAKAAGPYLATNLGSMCTDLVVTCCWALGNLSGSGPIVSEILIAQGALSKLAERLAAPGVNTETQDAVLYALLHFTRQLKDDLRHEHHMMILQNLRQLDLSMAACQLLFILSCHKDFTVIEQSYLEKILQNVKLLSGTHLSVCQRREQCCPLIYLLRVLSNVHLSEDVYSTLIDFISDPNVGSNLKSLMNCDHKFKETYLWFLGNLYNYNSNNTVFTQLLCGDL